MAVNLDRCIFLVCKNSRVTTAKTKSYPFHINKASISKRKIIRWPNMCNVRLVHIVYFRCTLQGYNVVYLSSKHCHKAAHSNELQGFKRCSNMKLDE